MILNGLGFVSAPLYLFGEFFVGKATEHLLGEGIKPEHLNDDRIARGLDSLSNQGLTPLFTSIAMLAKQKCQLSTKSLHLDSSSFSLEGSYERENSEQSTESIEEVRITYGYSRDHRPDLKQFMMDVICTGDGDVPLFVRVGDGNESDRAIFAQLMQQFQQQWNLDSIYVADSALYSAENLQQFLIPNDEVLTEYKGQQSSERGFRFLKDPLFFTSSVFLNTPRRVAALAMVMGLCLLVYTLGQRQLRQALATAQETIPNQLKKPTSTPTLRWVFQCFQAVHLVNFDHQQQVSNLTDTRLWILRFLGSACQKYYLIC
jgi:transposase